MGMCGLTFDLSGPPKAGPLEGRVRPQARMPTHMTASVDAETMGDRTLGQN